MITFRGARVRRAMAALGAALVLGLLAPLGVVAGAHQEAVASVYDASSVSLKFKQANRVTVSATNAGKAAGDIMKYTSVATINGVVIDAVVRTVATTNASITKFDEGTAVSTPPVGSTQSVDDLFMSDISGSSGTESIITYEFSFYEGGTYTGVNTGVPVTLGNVAINSYDIDGLSGVKQFIDFRGFQSYKTYSESSTKGLDASDVGSGLVRFLTRDGSLNVSGTNGSYSFSRVQVNYDQISTLTVRIGELGTGTAYFALDFSAGGMWTTNGTTEVTPATYTNSFNAPPTTADISTFYAAQNAGYVFRASDFPYADLENNAFASLKVVTIPASGEGTLQYNTGSTWIPVSAGDTITVSDLDLGKLRLIPTATGGAFTFQVNDGLAFSSTATLTYTAPENAQTIDFANPGAQSGTTHTFASGATATSGLPVTLTSLSTGVCTVSGLDITTLTLPGGVTSATCVIIATQDGDADYGRAEAVTQQFAVTSLTGQTITFTNPGDHEYSSTPITTDAASTSALPVTLTSLTLGVCTISGTSIVPVGPGLCSVRASQAGNGTYAAASPVTRSFAITKVAQTITFAQPGTHSITTTPAVTAPTASSGLTPTLASSTTAVCTVSGTTVTLVATGTCTLTASQAGNSTYSAAADVTRSFAVYAVTTSALAAGQVGTAYSTDQTLAGALGGGSWGSTALPAGLDIDPATGEIFGTPTVTFDGPVTVGYDEGGATHEVTLNLEIVAAAAPTPQTITFAQPADRTILSGAFTVSPTSDAAGLIPTIASSTTSVCTVSGFTVTLVGAGTCTLTASEPGDLPFYSAAADVTRSFAVTKVPQTITFAALLAKPTYSIPFTIGATTDASGLIVSYSSNTPAVCTMTGPMVTVVAAGDCEITASQAGDATYLAATSVMRVQQLFGITTTSLPSGTVNTGYSTTLAVAGTTGGTWWVSSLPAGVTLDPATGTLLGIPTAPFDEDITVTYTKDGSADDVDLRLTIAAAPVPAPAPAPSPSAPTRPSARPAAPAPVTPVATPKPRTTVVTETPERSVTDTVDFGNGSQVASALGGGSDQYSQAVRSVAQLQSETISGFAPGSSVQVDVIGAKTIGTLAVTPDNTIDATEVAKAIRDATGGKPSDFVTLTDAAAVSAGDAESPTTARIPASDKEYFTLAGLQSPVTLGTMPTTSATSWVHFAVDVVGYKPGSTVYLAMTSQPVVFASSVVRKDGTASIAGDMALDVLPVGVHNLRVIGDRVIGAVSVDAAGQIVLTADQMREIEKFDQGTSAAVRITGDNTMGGSQLALRIIPLEKQVPWWLLWALAGLGLLLAVSRLARVGERPVMAWIKRAVFVLAGLVPVVVGLVIDVLPLTLAAAAVIVVGWVLLVTLPRLRRDEFADEDEWDLALADEVRRDRYQGQPSAFESYQPEPTRFTYDDSQFRA